MIRAMVATCIVVVAVLCTPAALVPVVNSADFIVAAAPIALVATLWPRRTKTPVGDAPAPGSDAPHVDASPTGLHR